MVTYAQLADEVWWGQETNAPAHAAFNARLRQFYGLTAAQCGSKGDNNHLRGRHRSRDWTRNSAFCTDRAYGDTDSRDKTGPGTWLRASDIGISGPAHWQAAKRIDIAVRSNLLPAVAEWFGTFDGQVVSGWYQGHTSSSDTSHLSHVHVGLWTSRCDDEQQLRLLGDIITGADDMQLTDMMPYVNEANSGVSYSSTTAQVQRVWGQTLYYLLRTRNLTASQHVEVMARLDEIAAAVKAIAVVQIDQAAVDQAVAAALGTALADPPEAFMAAIAKAVRKNIIAPEVA